MLRLAFFVNEKKNVSAKKKTPSFTIFGTREEKKKDNCLNDLL